LNFSRRSFILVSSGAVTLGGVLGARAFAADELRIGFIPEVATTPDSIAAKQPWVDYFEQKLGRKIKLIIPTNYSATVEALGNGSLDVAQFGALTYLKAQAHYGAKPLVQRVEDRHFHSLFITNDPKLSSLKELKGKTFAFGDVNSTSGHLIPAEELIDAGVDPEKDITSRFSGNHTNTAVAVNAAQVVAGALDETVYRKLVDDKTIDPTKARVFFTSRPFVDYVWAVRKDLDEPTVAAVKKAFIDLKDPKVLGVVRASAYVAADDHEYDTDRVVAKRLNLL
jgi:phosphonate transport system substrate-binding protein